MTKLLIRLFVVAAIAAAVYGGYRVYQQLPQNTETIPTAPVRRGDVVIRAFTRGELRPVRTASMTAPNLFGMAMINRMAQTGSLAKPGDLIAEFDDAELKTRIEEKQLEVEQVNEQIKKAQADLEIRANQDDVEMLRARYAVRRAELEVKRNELLSAIDQRRNTLNLEEARRRLQQLESDIKSRREQAQAEMAVLEERRRKANMEMERERDRLKQVKLIAPMNGLVAVKQNRSVNFMFGQQLPDWREGDQVQPGMPVADILDLSEMEVVAKVNELDRGNLREGQRVILRLDALPGRQFDGYIKTMSATASADVFSADPVKRFDVTFSLDMREVLLALGAKPELVDRILAQRKAQSAQSQLMQQNVPQAGAAEGGPEEAKPRPAKPRGDRERGGDRDANRAEREAKRKQAEALLAAAKLPPPPGEGDGLDVLLRPGLLVDVEIILEKSEKVLYVPAGALFSKDGKNILFVREGSRFVPRTVSVAGRSESAVIIKSGVTEKDVIALEDPANAGKKKTQDSKPGGPELPAGGGR